MGERMHVCIGQLWIWMRDTDERFGSGVLYKIMEMDGKL